MIAEREQDAGLTIDEKEKIRAEKRILKISLCATITFVVAEIICAMITGSMALLMDCVYDGTDMIMAIPFLVLVPQLYKPVTQKKPYGFAQVESLLLLFKYSALLILEILLVKESVESIMEGGNAVEATNIATFELCVSAGCLFMMLLIRSMAKKMMTPSIKAELFLWKLSALSTLGVGVGFILNIFLSHTSLAWIYPYVDPSIAIISAIYLAREPVEMVIESIRNLILFAPKAELMEEIESICGSKCKAHGLIMSFCEVLKTGRSYWVEVYFHPDDKSVDFSVLRKLYEELEQELGEICEGVWVEVVPDIGEDRL